MGSMPATSHTICLEHIRDPYLAEALSKEANLTHCTFCGRTDVEASFALDFELVVAEVREAINVLYADAVNVLKWDPEEGEWNGRTYDVWQPVDDVAEQLIDDGDIDALFREALVEAIGPETLWTDRDLIEIETAQGLGWAWDHFKILVSHETRFVFLQRDSERVKDGELTAAGFLDQFRQIVQGPLRAVSTIASGTPLYRGRLFETISIEEHGNAGELGPAPSSSATTNRMSPAGVTMMYASADPQTAIAEIAAHSPKPRALIGGFRPKRDLKVLDLSKSIEVPSLFDKVRRDEFERAHFLRPFVDDITRPIVLDGREHIEYVPTQIVTEYIRWLISDQLDGIALPSAQDRSPTYVLFFDASDVRDEEDTNHMDATFTLARADISAYTVKRSYVGEPG